MTSKAPDPNEEFPVERPEPESSDKVQTAVTESLDASLPGENIVAVARNDSFKKWLAIQCNEDGSFHLGVGNTEILARRSAALKGLKLTEDEVEKHRQLSQVVKDSEQHLLCKDELREVLRKQRKVIDLLLLGISGGQASAVEKPDKLISNKARVDTVLMMVQAVGVSLNSIYQLSAGTEMTVRDCFPIARSVVEGVVNIAFIMASDDEVAERAQQHALQKYYRDLDREATVGDVRIKHHYYGSVDVADVPNLKDAIEEFTTKKGQEVRDWTPLNIDSRIHVVQSKYGEVVGIGLAASRFSVYRHSSEIVHGTYFGARYFWQPYLPEGPARSSEDMAKYLFDHFFTIFNAAYFSVDSLFDIFDSEFGMPEVRQQANEVRQALRNLDFISEALSEEEKGDRS